MKYTLRIPTIQFGYIEAHLGTGTPEEAIEEHNRLIELYNSPKNTPNSGLNLKDLQRLLYKRLCNEMLQLEEVESLGTDKVYSQKDIHKILESLLAKARREAGEDRINKEVDIRYN